MKYQEWLINWLNNYIQPSSKQRTYTRYSEIVNQHIIPKLGDLDLNELTPFTLQCFVTELLNSGNLKTGKGLSPNSVNAIITVMQNSLKTAYALGYMNDYTADKIKRPKTGEKKVECFSSAEQKRMEQYIMSKDKPKLFGVFLCLYTGLRIGELLALEWTDIDFVKGELRVNKTCHDGRNQEGVFGRITDIPKTQASIRTIPLPKQFMPLLREAKKKKPLDIHRIEWRKTYIGQILPTHLCYVAKKSWNTSQGLSFSSAHLCDSRPGMRNGRENLIRNTRSQESYGNP